MSTQNNIYVVKPEGGLNNKLRVVLSYKAYAESINKKLIVIWTITDECPGYFLHYFKPLNNVTFYKNNNNKFKIDYTGCYANNLFHNENIYKNLILTDIMQEKLNNIKNKLTNNYIALHIRRTDHVELSKMFNSHTTDEEFINFINTYPQYNIYIATDNNETQQKFKKLYNNRIPYMKEITKKNIGFTRNTSLEDAIIDMFMCINAIHFKGSGYSSFSDTIKFIRNDDISLISSTPTNFSISEKTCIFGGCVKNCGKYIVNVFNNIEKLGKLFKNYKIIMYYDESTDNSLDLLRQMKKKYKNLIIFTNRNPLHKDRVVNICNARNRILAEIKKINNNDNWIVDYFIMLDCDNVCSNQNINLNNFIDVFKDQDLWDSISFNRNGYYDIWALSTDKHILSCWHLYKEHGKTIGYIQSVIQYINNELKNNNYLKVYSAFNGFAIYKYDKFKNIKYECVFEDNLKLIPENLIQNNLNLIKLDKKNLRYDVLHDCEHRYFHLKAIQENNAKIVITNKILF